MDWGTTTALVMSGLALLISVKAAHDAKQARAEAGTRADDSRPGTSDTAEPAAADDTARPAEAADAGSDAGAETGSDAEAGSDAGSDDDSAPSGVDLVVRHVENDLYRLTNRGTAPAVDIVFEEDRLPAVFLLRAAGDVSLQPDEEVEFVMAGSVDKPLTDELAVRWDGQEAPVVLSVPVPVKG